jgi:phosphate/sulfate permease
MLKYVLAWLPLVMIAMLNGSLREGLYGKYLSELQAHQVSTVSGVLLFGIYIWVLVRLRMPASSKQAINIGLIWLGLTVAFEFLFMHYVAGRSWDTLLHDYNIFDGRVWVVVLVWVTIAPYIFYRLQKPIA